MLCEKPKQRKFVQKDFYNVVRSNYDDLNSIAQDIKELGFPSAAIIFNERLPLTTKARSGELGEIIATEFAEEILGFKIPIRRIRYKEGREMALRGDDFIGVNYNVLKGDKLMLNGIHSNFNHHV